MRHKLPYRRAAPWAAAVVALLITGCAAAPREDGGIVGTGNRSDCEEPVRKDGSRVPPAEGCLR